MIKTASHAAFWGNAWSYVKRALWWDHKWPHQCLTSLSPRGNIYCLGYTRQPLGMKNQCACWAERKKCNSLNPLTISIKGYKMIINKLDRLCHLKLSWHCLKSKSSGSGYVCDAEQTLASFARGWLKEYNCLCWVYVHYHPIHTKQTRDIKGYPKRQKLP